MSKDKLKDELLPIVKKLVDEFFNIYDKVFGIVIALSTLFELISPEQGTLLLAWLIWIKIRKD